MSAAMSTDPVLSYAAGPAEELSQLTIYEALVEIAGRFPDAPALISRHQSIRLSWSRLLTEVNRTAAGLAGMGLGKGDRAGIWSSNCAEWIYLQFACAREGIVSVNVNPAYRSHELAFVLRKSGMKAIFLQERDHRVDYTKILEEALGDLIVRAVFLGAESFAGMLASGLERPPAAVSCRDAANIQYTSGTTGSPKGVLLTHHNILNNGRLGAARQKLNEQDRIVIPVPLYHCFGCVMGSLAAVSTGAAMILPAPQFDAGATLEAIHEERGTAIYGVPTMFIAELTHANFASFNLTSLRTGIMAGAPCPIEVMKRVVTEMHCREITIAYGQTESSPVITQSLATDPLELRVSTVGCAMPCTEVKIIDPDTAETVPRGQQGELCTRGYLVMAGYDGEPEATAKVLNAEGWLRTGDLATMREDGYFRITGRSKDMILRGGENIYPREIEEFLYAHPKVADVQVVGLPDARLGESVLAWIKLKPGEEASTQEIREFCQGKIAHFKIPEHIRFVDAFPMTVTGKIQKFRIRQYEIEQRGLQDVESIQTA